MFLFSGFLLFHTCYFHFFSLHCTNKKLNISSAPNLLENLASPRTITIRMLIFCSFLPPLENFSCQRSAILLMHPISNPVVFSPYVIIFASLGSVCELLRSTGPPKIRKKANTLSKFMTCLHSRQQLAFPK